MLPLPHEIDGFLSRQCANDQAWLRDVFDIVDDARRRGTYDDGYNEGRNVPCDCDVEGAWDDGHEEGVEAGKRDGAQEAIDDAIGILEEEEIDAEIIKRVRKIA